MEDLTNFQKIILDFCILHNMSIKLGEILTATMMEKQRTQMILTMQIMKSQILKIFIIWQVLKPDIEWEATWLHLKLKVK